MYQIDYMSVEMCSQKPSQREYHDKGLYVHAIEFRKGVMLSKLIKVYLISLLERISLNRQIDEELRKVLEWPIPSKSTKYSQALQISIGKFLIHFAKISKLLFNLAKKNSIWT